MTAVEKGEMTYKQAQSALWNTKSKYSFSWLRKHGSLNWGNPKILQMLKSKETPVQKIKRLEKELADEKLRTKLLNRMIDISDKQYGTSIRNKSLPKQSKGSSKSK